MNLKLLIISLYIKSRIFIDSILKLRLNKYELNGLLNIKTKLKFKFSYSIDLPFSLGRTVRGLAFNSSEKDPYSKVVFDLLNGVNKKSIVQDLYSKCIKYKGYTVKKFINSLNDEKFKSQPLWAIVNPWDKISVEDSKQSYINSFYKNRSQNNLAFDDNSNDAITSKIYSIKSAESQVIQFDKLLKKIQIDGFKNNFQDLPTAIIFYKNDKWFWMMGHSGNHRSHISCELNNEKIKCKIAAIVDFDNLGNCFNVVNGSYNIDQAKLFFNRVFNGLEPIRGPI